jgi:hypothetical protein
MRLILVTESQTEGFKPLNPRGSSQITQLFEHVAIFLFKKETIPVKMFPLAKIKFKREISY